MYLCAKINSMKQEMNKGKFFINLISIALLLLYSMEGLSVTVYDRNISCIKQRSKKDKNTDSLFLKRIIDGDFFDQEHSEEQDYVLVIKHCLSHTDESYDETFSDGLSRMLQKYPPKIEGLRKALKRLPPKQRDKANYNMIVFIVSAWVMEQGADSIDPKMFYHTFPFLEQSSMIDKILMEQVQ